MITDEDSHHTLLIYEAAPQDAGLYECIATNKLGRQTTGAKLIVQGQFMFWSKVTNIVIT